MVAQSVSCLILSQELTEALNQSIACCVPHLLLALFCLSSFDTERHSFDGLPQSKCNPTLLQPVVGMLLTKTTFVQLSHVVWCSGYTTLTFGNHHLKAKAYDLEGFKLKLCELRKKMKFRPINKCCFSVLNKPSVAIKWPNEVARTQWLRIKRNKKQWLKVN